MNLVNQSDFCTIHEVDLKDALKDWDSAKKYLADVCTLSYGNEQAKNPDALMNTILKEQHHSVLEFFPLVPVSFELHRSLRSLYEENDRDLEKTLNKLDFSKIHTEPFFCIKIKTPIFHAMQIMNKNKFAYLELSRRYTKDSKVPFEFFDEQPENKLAVELYNERIKAGMPAQQARKCIHINAFTEFFMCGTLSNLFNAELLHLLEVNPIEYSEERNGIL